MTYPTSQLYVQMSVSLSWEFSPDDPNRIFVSKTKPYDSLEEAEIPVYLKISLLLSVYKSGGWTWSLENKIKNENKSTRSHFNNISDI